MHSAQRPDQDHRSGFTLVELLVVIGIIAVMIGILLPVLSRTRESGNTIKCRANLTQIGQALRQYSNDNKDHFPTPEAIGDSPTVSLADSYRIGIEEPDPATPTTVETLGLHNMLYRLGYLKAKEVWVCPSAAGRTGGLSTLNNYMWNVSRTIASFTSLQRGRVPKNAAGVPTPGSWWYVQDNYGIPAQTTNVPKTSDAAGVFSNFWYLPHQYKMKQKVTFASSGRQGSTNVLFYDGAVGYFVYNSSTGSAVQSVIRGE